MMTQKQSWIDCWSSAQVTHTVREYTIDCLIFDAVGWLCDIRHIPVSEIQCLSAVSAIYRYCDVIMGAIASQITILTIVCTNVYSFTDQRRH